MTPVQFSMLNFDHNPLINDPLLRKLPMGKLSSTVVRRNYFHNDQVLDFKAKYYHNPMPNTTPHSARFSTLLRKNYWVMCQRRYYFHVQTHSWLTTPGENSTFMFYHNLFKTDPCQLSTIFINILTPHPHSPSPPLRHNMDKLSTRVIMLHSVRS